MAAPNKASLKRPRWDMCEHLWAMNDTVDCFLQGCVACAYKIVVTTPAFIRGSNVHRLEPPCVLNTRPELCHRVVARSRAHAQQEEQPEKTAASSRRGLYGSEQNILVVGDGNFSFSLCLALARAHLSKDNAAKLVCTSFQTAEEVRESHPDANANIETLLSLGCIVLHGVDATALRSSLQGAGYDCDKSAPFATIVFNFPCVPHAGTGQDAQATELVDNQTLVREFLAGCGKQDDGTSLLATGNGEVHIVHKTKAPFWWWNIATLCEPIAKKADKKEKEEESSAADGADDDDDDDGDARLVHVMDVVFDRACYPEYVCRKAEDSKSFPVHDAVTHVFAPRSAKATWLTTHTERQVNQGDDANGDGEAHGFHVDWATLPNIETKAGARLVKLNENALWAVVGMLQFAKRSVQDKGGMGKRGRSQAPARGAGGGKEKGGKGKRRKR